MHTYHIHINGIVQGVGFRPLVCRLAKQMNLHGYVNNGNDGVHIVFNADKSGATAFLNKIKQSPPATAKILSASITAIGKHSFSAFTVLVAENKNKEKQVLVTPDKSICKTCREELFNPKNRRFRYPFITCTDCGPRYSIIQQLPYERAATSMQKFIQCKPCSDEYHAPENRRFLSQTNSCLDCGISLSIFEATGRMDVGKTDDILHYTKKTLESGKIVAVKGIGGYLLLCDAGNQDSILRLRQRKNRPSKPFAVLFPDTNAVERACSLNKTERKLLESEEAPIVLLKQGATTENLLALDGIAPGLRRVGVLLPYNPLLALIAADFGKPLVATSANISGSPIIFKDEEALAYLFEIADTILTNNREIIIPQDDSVVIVSEYAQKEILLRRSRGYAPTHISYTAHDQRTILATGALLKSSFSISANGNTFISQYLGNTESYESQLAYQNCLQHWLHLYQLQPAVVLADLHPDYFAHRYSTTLANNYKAENIFIQHHEAHFAAVLAENNLMHCPEPVLGVIWDGTGFGRDGNSWGGEFFCYNKNTITRAFHFHYFPLIAGDKSALEPRIAALCIIPPQGYHQILKEKFTNIEWNNYLLLKNNAKISSASVGRIFDAAASLLGLCDKQTYEGQAAMQLQCLAETYVRMHGLCMDESYFSTEELQASLSAEKLLLGILNDISLQKAPAYIAAKFHYSMAKLVYTIAQNSNCRKIAFSGGVFQNALLVDWIIKEQPQGVQLYFHKSLSPNDENISFGQLAYYDNHIKSLE